MSTEANIKNELLFSGFGWLGNLRALDGFLGNLATGRFQRGEALDQAALVAGRIVEVNDALAGGFIQRADSLDGRGAGSFQIAPGDFDTRCLEVRAGAADD